MVALLNRVITGNHFIHDTFRHGNNLLSQGKSICQLRICSHQSKVIWREKFNRCGLHRVRVEGCVDPCAIRKHKGSRAQHSNGGRGFTLRAQVHSLHPAWHPHSQQIGLQPDPKAPE